MRKRARTIFVIGMLYLLITVCTSNWGQASFFQDVFSEPTAHNEHGGSSLLGPLINFLVLFGGLTLVLRKPIAGFFKKYIQTVQKDLSEAAASRTTSESNLKQINARLKKMAKEADDIRAAAEEAGKADKERILATSRASAEKIKAKTAADIELISQFG
ncbi:MAG: ATP synthase F0 subunit B, partial [Acidobacteria bacterium]|nr:ATP synthase F0 subunit B [Acidobacteriota bacterium]